MPGTALVVLIVYLGLAFGLRTWLQWLRSGSTGFRGISGRTGSAEWSGGVLFVAAVMGIVLAPVAALFGWAAPLPILDAAAAHRAWLVLAGVGVAATLWSQLAMGESWRIGVDPRERTRLVTNGPFRWVRNPIFTGMAVVFVGVVLLTPTLPAVVALLALLVALQLQVRRVEEPYLLRTHGAGYRAYAARAGRFVPGIGRLAD